MKAIGLKFMRLAVVGAACGVVGVFAIWGAWRFCYPYAEEFRTRRELAQLDRRVTRLRAEHRQLQQQAQLLATPEGIKIEARRLGLLKPGERSLRFMTQPEPRRQPTPQKPPAPTAGDRLRAWGDKLLTPAQPAPKSPPTPADD